MTPILAPAAWSVVPAAPPESPLVMPVTAVVVMEADMISDLAGTS